MLDKLNAILKDLESHKGNSNVDVLYEAIQKRLEKSLQTYYKELMDSFQLLEKKNSVRMLKKINKTM